MAEPDKPYPDVDPNRRFPELEARILEFWKEAGIFQESVDQREHGERGGNEYVFYEGLPTRPDIPDGGRLHGPDVSDLCRDREMNRRDGARRRTGRPAAGCGRRGTPAAAAPER